MRREWPVKKNIVVGDFNVIREPLSRQDKIILPPLHIKLVLTKQFVTSLIQDVRTSGEKCAE